MLVYDSSLVHYSGSQVISSDSYPSLFVQIKDSDECEPDLVQTNKITQLYRLCIYVSFIFSVWDCVLFKASSSKLVSYIVFNVFCLICVSWIFLASYLPSIQPTTPRKCACWEQALLLLTSMESRSLEGNFITISALISACEKGHQWEIALQLLASPGHKNHGSQHRDGQGEQGAGC